MLRAVALLSPGLLPLLSIGMAGTAAAVDPLSPWPTTVFEEIFENETSFPTSASAPGEVDDLSTGGLTDWTRGNTPAAGELPLLPPLPNPAGYATLNIVSNDDGLPQPAQPTYSAQTAGVQPVERVVLKNADLRLKLGFEGYEDFRFAGFGDETEPGGSLQSFAGGFLGGALQDPLWLECPEGPPQLVPEGKLSVNGLLITADLTHRVPDFDRCEGSEMCLSVTQRSPEGTICSKQEKPVPPGIAASLLAGDAFEIELSVLRRRPTAKAELVVAGHPRLATDPLELAEEARTLVFASFGSQGGVQNWAFFRDASGQPDAHEFGSRDRLSIRFTQLELVQYGMIPAAVLAAAAAVALAIGAGMWRLLRPKRA